MTVLQTRAGTGSGIPAPRVAGSLLGLATVILALRLPGAVVLSFVLPAVALALCGLFRPRRDSATLWWFLSVALVCATLAQFTTRGQPPLINFATLTFTFAVFAAAVLATGTEHASSRAVLNALFLSFAIVVLIGWGEVVTGFKLQTVLYPDASSLQATGRFYVAAFFPNYNDFGVVVTMFCMMALASLLFRAGQRPWARLLEGAGFVAGAVLVVAGGSRGALAGLLIGAALLVFLSIRAQRPRLISGGVVLVGGLVALAAVPLVWSLPAIQDTSTQARGNILANTVELSLQHPSTVLLGWGNSDAFDMAAAAAFPDQLMNPHNLLLEVFTWYGLPGLVAFTVLWCYVAWRGIWRMEVRDEWTSIAAVVLFTLTPVLGVVPSSTLRYYYIFLLAACAVASLSPRPARH